MRTLVVGIGNTILGDDGVGVHVVRRLRERDLPEGVDLEEIGIAGLGLLDLARGYDRLIAIDAILTGAAPGTIHVLEGDDVARAAHLGPAHEADLPGTLEIGRKLLGDAMPREVLVVAIEVVDVTTFSEKMSCDVEAAIPWALEKVEALLRGL
ncbi:MAG: hydrogenase maturation protease [Planctomycetes bacterium]|nr:hydrogenase maturation protease [Planctomycetota bacterium]